LSLLSKHSWRESFLVYFRPRVVAMLFLGFQAGLPFLLVFSTLTAWLKDEGLTKTTIGFFAWVGITYSIKVFWAPVIDHISLPVLGKFLGHRRSWMLLAMIGVGIGLFYLSSLDPGQELKTVALAALFIAFCSATQDIVIDAYRIEAMSKEYQAPMAGAYQAGWRIGANFIGGALALYLADIYSWNISYSVMAYFVGIGIVTVLIISEPDSHTARSLIPDEERVKRYLRNSHNPNRFVAWVIGAIVCPFTEFFERNKNLAIGILLFIGLYRISDITLAVMANPFYLDLGFTKSEIAFVTKIIGVIFTIVGALLGGMYVIKQGIYSALLVGSILVASTNLAFAILAQQGHDMFWFTTVIGMDNFSGGFASSAFLAFLASLTNKAYTATQYALFSSLMTLVPKFISGFSGIVVDATSYTFFFMYVASLGIPALLMVLWLKKQEIVSQQLDE